MRNFYFRKIESDFGDDVQLDLRARLAFDLIHTYGLISAHPDGEDGANRQKLRLLTPEEIVARCFAISEITIAKCEQEGYLKPITVTAEELEEEADRRRRIHVRRRLEGQRANEDSKHSKEGAA